MKSADSTFQERAARAASAKQKALDLLRAKTPVDEAELAERRAARLVREAAEVESRIAKRAAKQQADAEKAARAAEALAEQKALKERPEPTEAERKAARDARYAARKRRS